MSIEYIEGKKHTVCDTCGDSIPTAPYSTDKQAWDANGWRRRRECGEYYDTCDFCLRLEETK